MKSRRLWMPGLAGLLVAGVSAGLVACGDDKVLKVDVPADALRADGKTAATVTVTATQGDKALEGEVTVKSDLGVFDSPVETPEESDKGGEVSGTLSAGTFKTKLFSAKAGTANITVTFQQKVKTGSDPAPMTQTAKVTFGGGTGVTIASLEFVSATPETIQLSGSGGTQTSTVVFRAKDTAGGAVPEGLDVTFALGSELGGATLEPTAAKTTSSGTVSTVLKSGTAVGTVKVKATAGTATAESQAITIAGGAANYRNFSFVCERNAIGGFHKYGLTMNCTALVADRKSQKLAGVQVTFKAEAGSVEGVISTDTQGNAVTQYKTQDPKPADVNPNAGLLPAFMVNPEDNGVEPSWSCPRGTCNPRDGLVTVIAMTAGEEQWTDTNNNGQWDLGEPFVDLPEPYIDINDNGQFDPNDVVEKDLYEDANQDKKWNDANGKWDSSTLIWKATKFVWTGGPNTTKTKFYDGATGLNVLTGLTLPHCGAVKTVKVGILDDNLNFLATNDGDDISCTCSNGACLFSSPDTLGTHSDQFGRRLFDFTIGDAHTCSPDCKSDTTPCGTINGAISCTAKNTEAPGGPVTVIDTTVTLPVTMQ